MKSTPLCALVAAACAAHSWGTTRADTPEQVILQNGAVVWLAPVEGVRQVAVEAIYEVGFLHEPVGMTQTAHLLEHLVCLGATDSFREKESFQRINEVGMANAETLGDWTHFDYVVPADKLELALQIEAERLSSLRFDEQLIRTEAKRCYEETDAVEQHPASGMLKHAMMACSQAWRHGTTSALVRGGLEEIPVDRIADFHRAYYRPERLTLVIVGDFDPADALAWAQEHIGGVQVPPAASPAPLDWTKAPRRHTIGWDASVRGVSIAYVPPENSTDAAILSLFGVHLLQKLASDPHVNALADAAFCSTHQWKVGTLPFFSYAAAKEGQTLDEVEHALKTCLDESLVNSREAVIAVKMFARQLEMQALSLDRALIENQVRQLVRLRQLEQQRASAIILGQGAINLGLFHRLTGPKSKATLERIQKLTNAELEAILETYLNDERLLVTHIVPLETP